MSATPEVRWWPLPYPCPELEPPIWRWQRVENPDLYSFPGVGFVVAKHGAIALPALMMGAVLLTPPVAICGAVASGAGMALRFFEYRIDKEDEARKKNAHAMAVADWKASIFEPCVKEVSNRSGLADALWYFRNGRMPPTSEIIIAPPYGEKIRSVFIEADKFFVQKKIEQIEMAEGLAELALSVVVLLKLGLPAAVIYTTLANDGMKGLRDLADKTFRGLKDKKLRDFHFEKLSKEDQRRFGEKMAKIIVKKGREDIRHNAAFDHFLSMESAWIVWEMACNGVRPITMADGHLLLRWGHRKESDFK